MNSSLNIIVGTDPFTFTTLLALFLLSLETPIFATQLSGQVIVWGKNTPNMPDKASLQTMTNVVAISAGADDCLALKNDGTVVEWNSWHSAAPAGLSNVVAISCGGGNNLALKADSNVVAWGNNYPGHTNTSAGLSNVVAVAARDGYNYALKRDGTLVGWGRMKAYMELSNIVTIAAFDSGGLALKKDGTVLQWGRLQNQSEVVAGLSNVVAVAAGSRQNLALKQDGTVYGWGFNDRGEATGEPTTTSPSYANGLVKINGQVLTNVVAIAAGGDQLGGISLALKNDGTVVFWGFSLYHRMDLPEGLSNVVAIAAGEDFCLAITTNRAVAEKLRH